MQEANIVLAQGHKRPAQEEKQALKKAENADKNGKAKRALGERNFAMHELQQRPRTAHHNVIVNIMLITGSSCRKRIHQDHLRPASAERRSWPTA